MFVGVVCDCIRLIVAGSAGDGCLFGYGLVVCKRVGGLALVVLGCDCG